MATFGNFVPSFVERYPGTTLLSTITLAAGVIFTIFASSNNNTIIQYWRTQDGRSRAYMTSSGNLVISGSVLEGASALAAITQTDGDARYVNTSGDTMTGALAVKGTLSGENLIVSGVSSFSGASTFKSTMTVRSTLSGGSLVVSGGNPILGVISNTAVRDFGNLAAIGCEDTTISATGAALGDTVSLGVPNGSVTTNIVFSAWVAAANSIDVRACTVISGNPASGTFRVSVMKF